MVSISTSRQRHSVNGRAHTVDGFGPELKARIFLFAACFWPLWILALFGASAPQTEVKDHMNLRSALDRVDIMGYGPTHPRVAVVVTGSDRQAIIGSVESVISNTDLNRLFLICVVMDGHAKDDLLEEELLLIDSGAVPHWHGLKPHIHKSGSKGEDGEPHSKKIHVLFNPTRQGVASSRLDGAEFIKLLEKKHEEVGFKSPQEDLLLVFLQNGSKLIDNKWLGAVTSSLIVPPPLLNAAAGEEDNVAMKLANAVALRSENDGKQTSFDHKLNLLENEPTADAIDASSKRRSYPTPALNADAVALRLDTFLNLPAQDRSLMDYWEANLDLTMNLWLCGDGIDIVEGAEVSRPSIEPPKDHLSADKAARFAAVWMEKSYSDMFLEAFGNDLGITKLDWLTKMTIAKQSPDFPKGMQSKCRSFRWYAENVNKDLGQVHEKHDVKIREEINAKEEAAVVHHVEKEEDNEHHEAPAPVRDELQEESHKQKPSKPLRKLNLEIVQKAKPIDISFQDVSGGHKDHPHMGAKDADGNWGYIHDETALRKNPPNFSFLAGEEEAACRPKDNHYKMMTKRVKVEMDYDKKQEESGSKRDKIFCLVYTIEEGHDKIPNIRETWGSKCDGFMVGSTKTDPSIGAVEIPHEGKEECKLLYQNELRSFIFHLY